MQITTLQYSFVGLWKTAPNNTIITDRAFVRSLLDDPLNTTEGIDAAGSFTISHIKNGIEAIPLLLNKERIQVTMPNPSGLSSVVSKISAKVKEINPGLDSCLEIGNYGITLELEVEISELLSTNIADSSAWISEKFVKKGLNENSGFSVSTLSTKEIVFEIENENGEAFMFSVQPRFGTDKSLYIRISKQINSNLDLLEMSIVENSIKEVEQEIRNKIPKLLSS